MKRLVRDNMGPQKPIHYLGAALILLLIGAAANIEISGLGRASGMDGARDSAGTDSDLSAPGVNAFSAGTRDNLDFAFYEEFLRNRNQYGDGGIADKTGDWSKGSNTKGAGDAPDLQRVSQLETIFLTPSPIRADGTTGGGAFPAGDLFGAAFFNDTPFGVPGLIPAGFTPNDTPPLAEVPVPPAAILFASAIAGFAFARRSSKR